MPGAGVRAEAGVFFHKRTCEVVQSMSLFKSKTEKELDKIILKLEMNMSNNYKDNAQANLRELEEALNAVRESGAVKDAVITRYASLIDTYKQKMKGYTHKDQKPYWT